MGYYVEMTDHNAKIAQENLKAAYEALCALNSQDELKRGGVFGQPAGVDKPAGSRSVSNSPHRWFSWMDWNYDETCGSVEDILEMLGFELYTLHGDVYINGYDNKMGQEELFLEALAPFIAPGNAEIQGVDSEDNTVAYIQWRGEDDDEWRWEFHNGNMTTTPVQSK